MTPTRHLLAIEAAFLLVWSSGFIGAKFGLPYAGTFTFLFRRYLLLAWLAARGELRFGDAAQVRRAAAA